MGKYKDSTGDKPAIKTPTQKKVGRPKKPRDLNGKILNEPDISKMSPQKRAGRPRLPRDADGNIIRDPGDYVFVQCTACGEIYKSYSGNFPTSNSVLFRGTGGYVPICKTCLNNYYEKVVLPAFDGSDARAVEHICGIFDWYYDDELLDMANKLSETYREGPDVTMIVLYGQRRNMTQFARRGATYLDRAKQMWESGKIVRAPSDMPDGTTIDDKDVWFFGEGYKPMEYHYLREQYDDWCDRYDCQTKAQEEIFKSLSIAQLNVQKAQATGDQKKSADAMRILQDLMDSAKIKPKQKQENELVEQNTFGTLIKRWENEEPIPEPLEEWKDVDGIRKSVTTWLFGHLAAMFKLDNDSADLYEEELAKYTVEPPHYEEDSEDEDEDFNRMFAAMRSKKAPQDVDIQMADANSDGGDSPDE